MGFSSWLLRDPEMKVRSSYPEFIKVADGYFTEVFRRVANLQFQKGDGPIIAIQVHLHLSFFLNQMIDKLKISQHKQHFSYHFR